VSSIASPELVLTSTLNWPGDVQVDSTGVYWDDCGAGIWHVAGIGSLEQNVSATPSCAYRIALDGDTIWATSAADGSLYRVPKMGGPVTVFPVLPSATDTYALAFDATYVYFATYEEISPTSEYKSRLYRIAKTASAGTAPETLQGGANFPGISDMTVDASFLYLAVSGSDAAAYKDGRIVRVPLADPNAAPEVIADNRYYSVAVAVDDQFIYWIDELGPGFSDAEIWRRAK
jgi:hypothetical protein